MVFAYWELAANVLLGIVWPVLIGLLGWRYGTQFLNVIRNFADEHEVQEASFGSASVKLGKKPAQLNMSQLEALADSGKRSSEEDFFIEQAIKLNNTAAEAGISIDLVETMEDVLQDILERMLDVLGRPVSGVPRFRRLNASEIDNWLDENGDAFQKDRNRPSLRLLFVQTLALLAGVKDTKQVYGNDEQMFRAMLGEATELIVAQLGASSNMVLLAREYAVARSKDS